MFGKEADQDEDKEDEGIRTQINKVNEDTEQRLKWIMVAENIAEVKRIKLDDVFELSITEFLNFLSYINWKNKYYENKYKK